MTKKIWSSGLWWPKTTKDAVEYCRQCNFRQRIGQPIEKDKMSFQLVLPLEPFQKWILDFVGPFKAAAIKTGNRYIIVAKNYCMKWVETKPLQDNTTLSQQNFYRKTYGVGSAIQLN